MAWKWMVRDDSLTAHAYIDDDQKQQYLAAACRFTAPSNALHAFTEGATFCVDCLVSVGRTLPETMDWRPA